MTSGPSTSIGKRVFKFTFNRKNAKYLKLHNFDVLSLANNHSLNLGFADLTVTKTWLEQAKLA